MTVTIEATIKGSKDQQKQLFEVGPYPEGTPVEVITDQFNATHGKTHDNPTIVNQEAKAE